jgi:hypothetical protein
MSIIRTRQKLSFADVFCTALAIASFSVAVFSEASAAEPSAAEIMAASKAAMSQPLKYRIVASGVEMVVYQKTLPDGSVASLTDLSSPVKRTSIVYGDKSYELYLEHRVAIDTRFMLGAAKSQAASISSMLGTKAAGSSKLLGTVQRDGRDCYQIESALTPDVVASLAKAAPSQAQGVIPAKFRYVIDKSTHFIVEQETLLQDGSPLSKAELRDVTPQPDLSDDFFQLPPGLEVKTPKSMNEYMSIVDEMLFPKMPPVTAEPFDPPPAVLPPKPPVPPRPARKPTPGANPGDQIELEPMATGRVVVLVLSGVVFVVLLAAAVFLRLRKAH